MTPASAIPERPAQIREQLARELAQQLSQEAVVRVDEPLAKRTTLRVGGPADLYVEPVSEEDLTATLRFCAGHDLNFFLLGRGSNLLVRDGGFRGVVICLAQANFSRIEIEGDRIRCGAGARLKQVAAEARRHGLSGVEFLEGIPGSVGGALRMNAGAMGFWTFNAVESVRIMDYQGRVFEKPASELYVEYRCCPLFKDHVALGTVFQCRTAAREEIEKRMNAYSQKRWQSQPAAPSAGCIFKNPGSIPAGKLIDELGLKGTRVGGAEVSPEHGNFIVNTGNATARDLLELIALVKARARDERNVELVTEVEIIGESEQLGVGIRK
jgi:UDP-N-acetylenolpyruvoylglucosamine reductase